MWPYQSNLCQVTYITVNIVFITRNHNKGGLDHIWLSSSLPFRHYHHSQQRQPNVHPQFTHPPPPHPTTPLSHHHRHTQKFQVGVKGLQRCDEGLHAQFASKDCNVVVHRSQSWNQCCLATLLRNLSSPWCHQCHVAHFSTLLAHLLNHWLSEIEAHTDRATKDLPLWPNYVK